MRQVCNVAFDTQVPKLAVDLAKKHGFNVVYRAHMEHDEYWIQEALHNGVDIFVSADWDIAIAANKFGKGFVLLRNRKLRGIKLAQSIISKLILSQKVFNEKGYYPEIL